jgi:hypothetical protein
VSVTMQSSCWFCGPRDQGSGGDYTIVGTRHESFVGQIPGKDVTPRVAAVAVNISPGWSKPIAGIAIDCIYREGAPAAMPAGDSGPKGRLRQPHNR